MFRVLVIICTTAIILSIIFTHSCSRSPVSDKIKIEVPQYVIEDNRFVGDSTNSVILLGQIEKLQSAGYVLTKVYTSENVESISSVYILVKEKEQE